MLITRRNISLAALFAVVLQLFAQGPNNSGTYYQSASGKKGSALKTALYKIVSTHKTISYAGLYDCYRQTDCRPDGRVWDMYSSTTNFSFSDNNGNYKQEGDMYNREHSFPQSWFKEASPMKTDIVHVVPTDGYVNNRRSSYPFGETDKPTYSSKNGFSKVGPSSVEGYSGTVFEPNDEYKGDFARIYFYMATCYENRIASWSGNGTASTVLAGNTYPAYKAWFLKMLLRWAKEDPVSQKEIDRNNAVYACQQNRNPYVDYPGLEQYVWGDKADVAFSYDNYDGTNPDPTPDPTPDPEPDPTPDPTPDPEPDPTPDGSVVFSKITSADQLATGTTYLVVYENGASSCALAANSGDVRSYAAVTIVGDAITTTVDESGTPRALLLGGLQDAYTFYDAVDKNYLALTSNNNKLHSVAKAADNTALWTVTFNDGTAHITNNKYAQREIRYNSSSPRFAAYTGSQQPVALYKRAASTGIGMPGAAEKQSVDVYSVTGVVVRHGVSATHALDGLGKGIYVVDGKKYVVR